MWVGAVRLPAFIPAFIRLISYKPLKNGTGGMGDAKKKLEKLIWESPVIKRLIPGSPNNNRRSPLLYNYPICELVFVGRSEIVLKRRVTWRNIQSDSIFCTDIEINTFFFFVCLIFLPDNHNRLMNLRSSGRTSWVINSVSKKKKSGSTGKKMQSPATGVYVRI